jgi:hypothetical protein
MKVTKRNLIRKCTEIWSKIIRFPGKCERCGKTQYLNSHHVIGRINYFLRFDLRNGCCLCSSCHVFSKEAAHNDPIGFINWFKDTRPDDYQYLLENRNKIAHYSIYDYQNILKDLKEKLKELGGDE